MNVMAIKDGFGTLQKYNSFIINAAPLSVTGGKEKN
jgi:hypothetical protein